MNLNLQFRKRKGFTGMKIKGMHCTSLNVFFLLLFLVHKSTEESPADGLPPSSLDANKEDIAQFFNQKRTQVEPAAANCIPALTWDDGLAGLAQAWSDSCIYAHGGNMDMNLATTIAPDGKPFGHR